MKVFFTVDGVKQGPYTVEQVSMLLVSGKLSMGDLAWYEGCAEWSRIHDMPEVVAAVLPRIPSPTVSDVRTPPVCPGSVGEENVSSIHRPRWWKRELWPEPSVAKLEARKKLFTKFWIKGLLASLFLISLGWLFETESKEKPNLLSRNYDRPQGADRYSQIRRMTTNGPFGVCGAIVLTMTIAFGLSLPSLDSQLKSARKKALSSKNNSSTK